MLITDFKDKDGEATELGRYMADQLHMNIANRSDLQVINRRANEALFSERKLYESGILSQDSMVELGKQAGAQVVVKGAFASFPKKLELNLEIIDLEEGVLIGGLRQRIPRTNEIDQIISSYYEALSPKTANKEGAYEFIETYITAVSHVLKNRREVSRINTETDLEFFYDLNFHYKTMIRNYTNAIGEITRFQHHNEPGIKQTADMVVVALEDLKKVSEQYLEILNGYFQYQQEIELSAEYQSQLVRAMSTLEVLSQDYWETLMNSGQKATKAVLEPAQITSEQKETLINLIATQAPEAMDGVQKAETAPAAAIGALKDALTQLS